MTVLPSVIIWIFENFPARFCNSYKRSRKKTDDLRALVVPLNVVPNCLNVEIPNSQGLIMYDYPTLK